MQLGYINQKKKLYDSPPTRKFFSSRNPHNAKKNCNLKNVCKKRSGLMDSLHAQTFLINWFGMKFVSTINFISLKFIPWNLKRIHQNQIQVVTQLQAICITIKRVILNFQIHFHYRHHLTSLDKWVFKLFQIRFEITCKTNSANFRLLIEWHFAYHTGLNFRNGRELKWSFFIAFYSLTFMLPNI